MTVLQSQQHINTISHSLRDLPKVFVCNADGLLFGHPGQLAWQAIALATGPIYAFTGTYILLRLIGLVTPLRVSSREEGLGLDVSQHGEEAYTTGEGAILLEPPPDGVFVTNV